MPSNSGAMTKAASHSPSNRQNASFSSAGPATATTRARLACLYGEDFTFGLQHASSGTLVHIEIPFAALQEAA